jgi:hypothetical protein
VRSACDSERPTTVRHGQSWSFDSGRRGNTQSTFALVRALEISPKPVVRTDQGSRSQLEPIRTVTPRAVNAVGVEAVCHRRVSILLTDLLTTVLDDTGCGWTRAPSASPESRPGLTITD